MKAHREDLYRIPRPVSKKYPPMPQADRAAQFSPFAALTGFDALVRETARVTEKRRELTEEEKLRVDRVLREGWATGNPVRVTCFVPDGKKQGGSYGELRGKVKSIDSIKGVLHWEDGSCTALGLLLSAEFAD